MEPLRFIRQIQYAFHAYEPRALPLHELIDSVIEARGTYWYLSGSPELMA
jgi:hypothetical protein